MTYPQQPPPPQPAPHAAPAWSHPAQPGAQPPFGHPGFPGYPPPAPPPFSPSGERLAEFADRLLARLVDSAIFFVAGMVLEIPLIIYFVTLTSGSTASQAPNPGVVLLQIFGLTAAVMALSLVATYVYEVEMMYRRGQTVGKRIMKIRVTAIDGSPLTRSAAAKRWLGQSVAGAFVPAYSWIDGLWQLWDKPYRQCLHDKFAATVVVKGEPPRGMA